MNETLAIGPRRAIPPLAALIAFERAAACGSFRRAARDLSVTPSAVSHQIRGLEAQFGVKLFAREGKSMCLTPDGVAYLARVSRALRDLEDAGREMLSRRPGNEDDLWISAPPFFTSTVLMPAISAFKERYPDRALRIEATHNYADFAQSRVDVAVRVGREHAEGLRLEPLLEVCARPVCSPQTAERGLQTAADLAGHVLIGSTIQPNAWSEWLANAGLAGLRPAGHLWFDNIPSMLEAAEQGLGVALAMDPLIRARRGFGTQLIAPLPRSTGPVVPFYLVYRTEQAEDRRVRLLRNWIRGALSDLDLDLNAATG